MVKRSKNGHLNKETEGQILASLEANALRPKLQVMVVNGG